jgi:hypothetical protein
VELILLLELLSKQSCHKQCQRKQGSQLILLVAVVVELLNSRVLTAVVVVGIALVASPEAVAHLLQVVSLVLVV